MDIAATITTGKNWPDEASPITGEVLIWSSEDSYADTLGPRLDAAGANLDKVHYATEIKEGENKIYFDLRGYAKFVLIKLGFSNIWCSSDDTYKKFNDFFSYRYSIHNKFTDYGRMLSVIKS